MTSTNNRLGIGLMALTMLVFALQDGLSRHLADAYSVQLVVMIRYWFFAAFVIALSARSASSQSMRCIGGATRAEPDLG